MTHIVKIPSREQVTDLLAKWYNSPEGAKPAVIDELRSFDQHKLITILGDLGHDPDYELQHIARSILLQLDREKGISILLPLLKHPNADTRLSICYHLYDYGDERAVEPLIQALREDSDSDVRYMAAAALGRIGNTRAIPALEYAVAHDKGTDYEGDPVSHVAKDAIVRILSGEST